MPNRSRTASTTSSAVTGTRALASSDRRIVEEPLHERPRQVLHPFRDRRIDVSEIAEGAFDLPLADRAPPA